MASWSCSKVVLGSRVKLADLPSVSVSLIFLLAGLLLEVWAELVGEVSVDDFCVGVGETLEPYGRIREREREIEGQDKLSEGGRKERERERGTLFSLLCAVAFADWLWLCCCCCCRAVLFFCCSLAFSSMFLLIFLSVSLMVSSSLWRVLDFCPVAIIFDAGREYSSAEKQKKVLYTTAHNKGSMAVLHAYTSILCVH